MRKLNVGFIGNFEPKASTENDRRWSLNRLGHNVVCFQENKVDAETILSHLKDLDLILYSHTHDPNFVIKDLKKVWKECKKKGIPTASVHLDRWCGLERVRDVGVEATWFTEYQFMADGSPEAVELYESLKLKWFFLKAGVVERDCYMSAPDPVRFPHEIVFTGSKGYHPEYKFRPQLIEFLKETYGNRFGHYGNDGIEVLRGHDLNTLYATARVVVGDSCFGGRPNYVSDRYYEVRGRGGLLIHPYVEGVDHEGVGIYTANDLSSLKYTIDALCNDYRGSEELRRKGFEYVKKYETYTNRMQEMLDIIFKENK